MKSGLLYFRDKNLFDRVYGWVNEKQDKKDEMICLDKEMPCYLSAHSIPNLAGARYIRFLFFNYKASNDWQSNIWWEHEEDIPEMFTEAANYISRLLESEFPETIGFVK